MISTALKQATKSRHKYKVGAVIIKGGRLLSVGYNSTNKTHPSNQTWENSCHAEEAAILKRIKIQNGLASLVGATIYVSRISASGRAAMAKPCIHCEKLIRAVGIKKVVYTNNIGETEVYHI